MPDRPQATPSAAVNAAAVRTAPFAPVRSG